MLTIIKNARIYSPQELGIADLAICGEKIIDLGPDLGASYPKARQIQARGLLAFPGYIDQHVHLTGGGGEGGFKSRVPELQLSSCIQAGVTTLVGVLGTDGITRSVENLLAKTKALREEGISAYCLTGSYEYPSLTLTGDLKKDIAFVQEILGVKVAISDHRCSHPTKSELIRLVSDVRMASLVAGKPGLVVFHVGRGKDQLELIFQILAETDLPIKHFRPTHLGKLQAEAVKFAKLGGYLDFTAGADFNATARQICEVLKQGAPLAKVILSSDANGSFPKWNERNELVGISAASLDSLKGVLRSLVFEEKLPLPAALSLITCNAADALELGQKGVLRPGADADLLLVDPDLQIETVLARGKVLMQNGKLLTKGVFES